MRQGPAVKAVREKLKLSQLKPVRDIKKAYTSTGALLSGNNSSYGDAKVM